MASSTPTEKAVSPPPESRAAEASATPAIAERLAAIESDRETRDASDNLAERALSGHRTPETVGTDEYAIRQQANAEALGVTEGT